MKIYISGFVLLACCSTKVRWGGRKKSGAHAIHPIHFFSQQSQHTLTAFLNNHSNNYSLVQSPGPARGRRFWPACRAPAGWRPGSRAPRGRWRSWRSDWWRRWWWAAPGRAAPPGAAGGPRRARSFWSASRKSTACTPPAGLQGAERSKAHEHENTRVNSHMMPHTHTHTHTPRWIRNQFKSSNKPFG